MTDDQRQAVMAVLAALLSPTGLHRIIDIMGADDALAQSHLP